MKHTGLVRVMGLVMVAVLAFGVVGIAAAQGPNDNPPLADRGPGQRGPGERVIGLLIQTVAESTGMDARDVVAAVHDGQTLNDILAANGVDAQDVIDTVKTAATEQINTALAEGKINEEQAAMAVESLDDLITNAMNGELPERDGGVRDRAQDVVEHTLVGVLAEMAGVDVRDLLQDAVTPPTLAEIAESYGLDANAIIAETEARITEEVNAKVADGTISDEQAATILDGLHDRLVDRFNSPLRAGARDGRPGGQRPGGFGGPGNGQAPAAPGSDV